MDSEDLLIPKISLDTFHNSHDLVILSFLFLSGDLLLEETSDMNLVSFSLWSLTAEFLDVEGVCAVSHGNLSFVLLALQDFVEILLLFELNVTISEILIAVILLLEHQRSDITELTLQEVM